MKSGKKMITGVAVLALIVIVAVLGRQYYQDRYVSFDYYAMIPLDYDVTPQTAYSDNGEDVGPSKKYTLTVYSAGGEAREVSFNVYAPGSPMAGARELPQPGQYLLVKASKTIVTGWGLIDKSEVPEKALERIAGSN